MNKKALVILCLFFCLANGVHASWDPFKIPSTSLTEEALDISFADASNGFALVKASAFSGYRIFRTTNGGQAWDQVSTGTISLSAFGTYSRIQFVSPTEGWFVPSWFSNPLNKQLLHTTNGGVTWDPVTTMQFTRVYALSFISPLEGWINGELNGNPNCIAHTVNGGATWAIQNTPANIDAADLFFVDSLHGWAVSDGDLFMRTIDGGVTWKIVYPAVRGIYNSLRFLDANRGFAVGESGLISFTNDGGQSWFEQTSGTTANLRSIGFIGGEGVIVTGRLGLSGFVLSSYDLGNSWRFEATPNQVRLNAIDVVGTHIFICGTAVANAADANLHVLHRTEPSTQTPVIKYTNLPEAALQTQYGATLWAEHGQPPYAWTRVSGPTGITVNATTGRIGGTPTQQGDGTVTVKVTDANNKTDQVALPMFTNPFPFTFTTAPLPNAVHRRTYRHGLPTNGGAMPYKLRVTQGRLPVGMTLTDRGVLAGVAQETGVFPMTIEAVDSAGMPTRIIRDFTLQVDANPTEAWDVQEAHNRVMDIHFFDQNEGVAGGWSGTVIRTIDGGRSWENKAVNDQILTWDWVGDRGWANGFYSFLRSTDRGKTWTTQTPIGGKSNDVDFVDANRGVVCGAGISYTLNGGDTWTNATTPAGHEYLDICLLNATFGMAGGQDGALVTTNDGGLTWQNYVIPGLNDSPRPAKTKSYDPVTFHAATGKTITEGDDPFITDIHAVFWWDAMTGWVVSNEEVITNTMRAYRTTNGGTTWTPINIPTHGLVIELEFVSATRGWACGPLGERVASTSNGGTSWSSVDFQGNDHPIAMDFVDSNIGFITINKVGRLVSGNVEELEGSIWKTVDGGVIWKPVYGFPSFIKQFKQGVTNLDDDTLGPNIVDASFPDPIHGWVIAQGTGSAAYDGTTKIFYTDNGGASWQLRSRPIRLNRLQFLNEWHGFALITHSFFGAPAPVMESRDAGFTWYPRYDIGGDGTAGRPQYSKSDPEAKSESGPTTEAAPVSGPFRDLHFVDDQNGWLLTSSKTLRTTDGGKTWTPGGAVSRNTLAFADRLNGRAYSLDSASTHKTSNGGATWENDIASGTNILSVHFSSAQNGWTVGQAGTWRRTTNNGATFPEQTLNPNWILNSVHFLTSRLGIAAGNIGTPVGDPILLRTKNGDFHTTDVVQLGMYSHNLTNIQSPDSENAWVFGDYGVVLKYSAPTNALRVLTDSLDFGTSGTLYNAQLQSQNGAGAKTWQVSGGALPPGLTLNASGLISGTPTSAGVFRFVAMAQDTLLDTAGKQFLLTIDRSLRPSITTLSLPAGTIGQAYGADLLANSGIAPYQWWFVKGDLPPGVTLKRYGAVGGFPTSPGVYRFTLEVLDSQNAPGRDRRDYVLSIGGPHLGQQTAVEGFDRYR